MFRSAGTNAKRDFFWKAALPDGVEVHIGVLTATSWELLNLAEFPSRDAEQTVRHSASCRRKELA